MILKYFYSRGQVYYFDLTQKNFSFIIIQQGRLSSGLDCALNIFASFSKCFQVSYEISRIFQSDTSFRLLKI